jgi:hypothetical protein
MAATSPAPNAAISGGNIDEIDGPTAPAKIGVDPTAVRTG